MFRRSYPDLLRLIDTDTDVLLEVFSTRYKPLHDNDDDDIDDVDDDDNGRKGKARKGKNTSKRKILEMSEFCTLL